MGIYISGVKGLPEQVQANKEDIKTIKEEIAGIDFEEIRQLEGQVGENTQDINNLEASIGVQNQAINSLGDRTTALERKTQLITYNDDLSKTDFRNSIEVADDVIASGVVVAGDGTMINNNGSGLHFQEGSGDDTLTIANNDGAVYHALQLHGDGTLTLDGQPLGGFTLFQHNITFKNYYKCSIESESSTPITRDNYTTQKILELLFNEFNDGSSVASISLKGSQSFTSSTNFPLDFEITKSGNTYAGRFYTLVYNTSTSQFGLQSTTFDDSTAITDNVVLI